MPAENISVLSSRVEEATYWETELDAEERRSSKRGSSQRTARWKHALEATRWLDGTLGWKHNRVVWRVACPGFKDEELFIEAAQLEETERLLALWLGRKSRVLPESSYHILRRREHTLQWAKEIATLQAPDLEVLTSTSRRRNPAAHQTLARLMVVEALATDGVFPSPSRALAAAFPESEPHLRSVLNGTQLNGTHWPKAARVLAALTLGRVVPDIRGEWKAFSRLGPRLLSTNTSAAGKLASRDIENGFAFVAQIAALDLGAAQGIVDSMTGAAPWKPSWTELRALSVGLSPQVISERLSRLLKWPEIWPDFPILSVTARGQASTYARSIAHWKNARLEARSNTLSLLWSLETEADQWRALVFLRRFAEFPLRSISPEILGHEPAINDFRLAATMAREFFNVGFQLAKEASRSNDFDATLQLLGDYLAPKLSPRRSSPVPTERRKGKNKPRPQETASIKSATSTLQPLLALCRIGGADVARRLYRKGFWVFLGRDKWRSREWLELGEKFLDHTTEYWSARNLYAQLNRFDSFDEAQRALNALLEAVSLFPADYGSIFCNDIIGYIDHAHISPQQLWTRLVPLMRQLANWPIRKRAKVRGMTLALRFMTQVAIECSLPDEALQQCYTVLLAIAGRKRWLQRTASLIDEAVSVGLYLSNGDVKTFERLMLALWPLLDKNYELWSAARQGAQLLRRTPLLCAPFVTFIEKAPQRALERLGELNTLSKCEATAPLLAVAQQSQPSLGESWEVVRQAAPTTEAVAQQWAFWRQVSGLDCTPPKSASKIAEWPQSFRRELAELEARPAQPSLSVRIENLKQRLSDAPALQAAMAREIEEVLRDNLGKAQIEAVEQLWRRAFRGRIRFLCGEFPAELENDENWRNAMLLACGVYENRRWAQKLLRGELARQRGEPNDWRLKVVDNAKFLHSLNAKGINVEAFLSGFEAQYANWTLRRETDPLQILQMGNRFNTCLSRGGINEHSSIANAIDMDKCVVYARDAKGHYVGRQLWAIADNGHLVGFTVYSTLPEKDKEQRLALKRAFTAHAREFAAQCGLELADEGRVEPLAVPEWYDDGLCAWEGDCHSDKIS